MNTTQTKKTAPKATCSCGCAKEACNCAQTNCKCGCVASGKQ